MALVHKLASFSVLSNSRNPHSSSAQPVCSLSCNSSTSPFTEKHSVEKYQRDRWVYENQLGPTLSCPLPFSSGSIREDDIALQLPELKKLLRVLREKRESEGKCGGGGEGSPPGNVFLVGTGPGDPELLTLKAVRVIKSADLLLYDRLVSNDVLDLVGPDAKLLYVGKTAGYHSRTQVKKGYVCCKLGYWGSLEF